MEMLINQPTEDPTDRLLSSHRISYLHWGSGCILISDARVYSAVVYYQRWTKVPEKMSSNTPSKITFADLHLQL